MFLLMSKSQGRIMLAANLCFDNLLPAVPLRNPIAPMYRQQGEGLSISLTTDDGPDVFIVRETVEPSATLGDVFDCCERLIRTLVNSHRNVQLHNLKGLQ